MPRTWVLPVQKRANKRETKSIKRFLNRTLAPLAGFIWIYLTGLTLRVTVIGKEEAEYVQGNDVILALWHSRIFYMPYHFRWQKKWGILVSPSSDGDIIDGIMKLFGFFTVRGSSFKSPTRALLILAREFKKDTSVAGTGTGAYGTGAAMIADGSRGPANAAQIGSVALAKLTGKPVVPIAFGAKRKKNLGSWDATLLPLPFTRINMVFGRLIYVDKKSAGKELESKRAELEKELKRITELADRF